MANIRVLDNKSGKPVEGVTVDNLKNYFNNPAYSIDGNSLIPVESQGKQDVIPVSQFNPDTMKLKDSNYQSPYEKYNSVSAQAQNIGRQAANALTLGGYAAVADRFKSDEELQDAKLREAFNPISTFVGQTLPYAIPVAGEALGALKAGTTALRLGEIAAAGMQSGVAKSVATAAIDGAAQGFTTGINEASLDNNLTRENLSNVLFSTLLGGGAGAAVGGVVGGISKASSLYKGIGEKLGSGEPIPTGTKFTDDLAKSLDSHSATETQLSQRQANLQSLANLSEQIELGAKQSAMGINPSSDHAVKSELFAGLAANPKLLDDIVNGKMDAQQFFDNATRYKELSRKAGQLQGMSESNPRNMIATQLNDDVSSVQSLVKEFNKASIEHEKIKIAENVESRIPQNWSEGMYNSIYSADESVHNQFLKTLDSYATDQGVFNRLKSVYPNASYETIESLVKSEKSLYDSKLLGYFKAGVLKEGAKLENIIEPKINDFYTYLDQSLTSLDKAWADYKASLPLGSMPSKNEVELYRILKQPFYDQISNPEAANWFSKEAISRAQTKRIRAELIDATNDVKKLIGQKGGDTIDLKKLGKLRSLGMGQGNPEVARLAPEVLGRYSDTVKALIPKMQEVYSELDGASLNEIVKRADSIKQNLNDIYLVNNKRVTDHWKATENGANAAIGHGVSTKTRLIRMAHDLAEGNILYAKMQGIGLLTDKLSSKVLDALGKSKTPQEVIVRRVEALKAISKGNRGLMDKVSEIGKKLVTVKATGQGALASSVANNLPWSVRHRTDKSSHEELNKKYEEAVKNVNDLVTKTGERLNQLDAQMKGIGVLAPNLYQQLQQDILQKAGILTRSLPLQSPTTYGKSPLTMTEKAHFIDQVEAGTDPHKMLDLMGQGTITPSQLSTFQSVYPYIFSKLKDSALMEVSTSKNPISSVQKARIYGIFGIPTSPVVSADNLMKEFMAQQQMSQQAPKTQQQPLRTSGAQKMSLSENYQRSGKP